MENLFANTGIGKHIIRTHHWGIVLPTLEKAEAFMKTFGLQEDYRGHVKAYDADLIFTKHGNGVDAVEFIIPLSGVLTEFNKGKGGIAHVAYLVDDINAVSEEIKAMGYELLEKNLRKVQKTSSLTLSVQNIHRYPCRTDSAGW